jgi:hypothetical protein
MMTSTTLYLSFLPFDAAQDKLRQEIEDSAQLIHIKIITNFCNGDMYCAQPPEKVF